MILNLKVLWYCFFHYSPSGSRPVGASVILPSYMKRKKNHGEASSSKRSKAIQCWDRDIVCLPHSCSDSKLSYPRGKYRTKLGEKGLIGKMRLMSSMSVEEVENEIRLVFKQPMGGRNDFPFDFLQATGTGTKTLTIPSVSPSFSWTAQQVAKLGGNKQAIYIIAKKPLILPLDSCEVQWWYMHVCIYEHAY